jgi:Tfp pilus assembly protein PilV
MVIPPRPHPRRGVVLVDAIIGAVLLGLALVAIIGLGGRALSLQARGQDLQIAAMLLDEQLNMVLMRGADNYTSRFSARGPCDAPYQDFSYELTFSGGSGGQPYLVRATVSWNRAGRTLSESIETCVAPRSDEEPDRRPGQTVNRFQ